MDELTSLGLILLLALLAGHLVKFVRVPEVTGYIIAGIVLGPSVLGWVSAENLIALEILSEVALGLILFSIGSVFEFSRFLRIGRQVLILTLIESVLASVIVTFGALIVGQPWQVAFLLGAIAIATAPASTLMVIRECDSAGPLTENLLGIIAVNNLFCIVAFSIVGSMIDLGAGFGPGGILDGFYRAIFPLFWQIVGSAALGYLVGLMLAGWATQVRETGELLILLAGSILLCVGVASLLDMSPLVASLAVGATMANLSARSGSLFSTLSGTDPPFYAIFFVIAGADLDLSLLASMGIIGVVYVVGRAAGKFAGAVIGSRWLGLERAVQQFLGFALLAQAGLAVGLTLAVGQRFEDYAPVVSTVVLAGVAFYEMIGPISTRFALVQAGESGQLQPSPAPADAPKLY